MIFVTVGTQKFQFNRLIQLVDDYVKITGDAAYGQIGNSTYIPKNYEYTNFLSKNEFNRKLIQCDLVITHSGVATIVEALKLGKPVLVVPRLKKFGEHVDNHQIQIAQSFSKQNYIVMYGEGNNINSMISIAKNHKFEKYISQRQNMIEAIESYLNNL